MTDGDLTLYTIWADNIEHISLTYNGETAKSIRPGKILNVEVRFTALDKQSQIMFVALYSNEDRLLKTLSTDGVVNANTIIFDMDFEIPTIVENGSYIRIFVWDAQTYAPLRNVITFSDAGFYW